jgi:hypothetical protein
MSGGILAADANAACTARSYEVQLLGRRLAACADAAGAVLARFRQVELEGWQSPAGRAYRNTVALQAACLGRVRDRLHESSALVARHAQAVAASSTRTPNGGY